MLSNPSINFVLYEWLLARLADLKRQRASVTTGAPQLSQVACLVQRESVALAASCNVAAVH